MHHSVCLICLATIAHLPQPELCSLPCSLPEEEDPPQPLLSSESLEWDAIANLDDFFRRIYKCAAASAGSPLTRRPLRQAAQRG
jgi:hypothetical protein